MEFVCYSSWELLPDGADDLFVHGERDSLFVSRHWFENLTAQAPELQQSLLLACVVADSSVLAILPLVKEAGNTWRSLRHSYTAIFSLLVAKNDQQEILNCLAKGLRQLPFQGLRLEPVAEDDTNLNEFQRAMESNGFSCQRHFRFYNWIHRTAGQNFTEYLDDRPSTLRNTIARKQRKLEREHDCAIRLFSGEDAHRALGDYHAVYRSSWKAYELHEHFIDSMTQRFSKMGWIRLGVLYIDGQPAAAQLWFVGHHKASIFRLAYDENWKRYSPGSILTAFLMEHVIDCDHVKEIDFLTGNEKYKQDWMSERRERWELVCVRNSEPQGRIEQLVVRIIEWLKSLKE